MRAIAGIELAELARELNTMLGGFYIDNVYEVAHDTLRLRLERGGSRLSLRCALPHCINITEYAERPTPATQFAMAARKRLRGARIMRIWQSGTDRVLVFGLERGVERLHALAELYGKGNFMIADVNMRVVLAYRDNAALRGSIMPIHDAGMKPHAHAAPSLETLTAACAGSEPSAQLVKAIARSTWIGTPYVEEAMLRSGIGISARISESDASLLMRISGEIAGIINAVKSPLEYLRDGKALDYAIIRLTKYEGLECKGRETLSQAIDDVYAASAPAAAAKNGDSAEAQRLIHSLERQRAIMSAAGEGIERARAAASFIFANLGAVNKAIEIARERKHATAEEIARGSGLNVVEVSRKDHCLIVEV